MDTTSRQCREGLHGFCKTEGCTCPDCHFTCSTCGGEARKLYGEGECAGCYRVSSKKALAGRTTPCDKCGASGAFRNPSHRRNEYLCRSCHIESGEPMALRTVDLEAVAPCAGKDDSDEAHAWQQVRGRKHVCRACGTKSYRTPARREEW